MMPVLFTLAGFEVFSAPVFAGLAAAAAFLCFRGLSLRSGLALEDLWGLVFVMAAGVLGGALLFYAVLYNGGLAENLPVLLEEKRVPGGAFWGSFWTALAFAFLYCRTRKIDFRPVADHFGLASMLGLSVMRIGCLLHGCCHGIPTAAWWGVSYVDARCAVAGALLGKTLHPTQLYEAFGCLAVFSAVYFGFLKTKRLKPGGVFVLSLVLYSVLRFFVDFYRGGDPGFFRPGYFTTAQLISLAGAAGSILWYRRA